MYVLKKDKDVVKREKKIKDVKDSILTKELKKEHEYSIMFDKKNVPLMKVPSKSILKKEGEKREKKKRVRIHPVPKEEMEKIMRSVKGISRTEKKIVKQVEAKKQIKELKKRLSKYKAKARYNERKAEEWKRKGDMKKADAYHKKATTKRIKEQDILLELERLK